MNPARIRVDATNPFLIRVHGEVSHAERNMIRTLMNDAIPGSIAEWFAGFMEVDKTEFSFKFTLKHHKQQLGFLLGYLNGMRMAQ